MTNQTNNQVEMEFMESQLQLKKTIEKLNASIEENNRVLDVLKEVLAKQA